MHHTLHAKLHQHANVLQQIKQTSKLICFSLQDMLSALLCKPSDRLVPRYRNSLLELESHFEVRGLPGPEKDLSYNEHSAAFNQAKQDVTGDSQLLFLICHTDQVTCCASLRLLRMFLYQTCTTASGVVGAH